jgi:predicted nuclease with TOPRIM domain
LCADDVVTRYTLVAIQDSYAEAMNKYGLRRGVKGSEARHITTQQYYRDLYLKNENLKENIEELQSQKAKASQELSRIKSGIKTEKLKNTAVNVATNAVEKIGSTLGGSKVKRLQQEVQNKDSENAELQSEIHSLKQEMQEQQTEHATINYKLKQELAKIHALFPKIKELLRIEKLCEHLGFGEKMTKAILEMKPVGFKGQLYSSEYKRDFETEHSVAEIKTEKNDPNKLQLTIDGVSDVSWFRQKYKEFQERIGMKVKRERGGKLRI